jgi:hypothetical protein
MLNQVQPDVIGVEQVMMTIMMIMMVVILPANCVV